MSVVSSSPTDRRWIRGLALVMTGVAWILGFCVARFAAEPPQRALVLSGIQAFGGLGAWWCYHLISRRNDGMAIFNFAVMPLLLCRPDRPLTLEVRVRLGGIVLLAAMLSAIGLVARWRANRKSKPTTSPFWDEQVDQPATSK